MGAGPGTCGSLDIDPEIHELVHQSRKSDPDNNKIPPAVIYLGIETVGRYFFAQKSRISDLAAFTGGAFGCQ